MQKLPLLSNLGFVALIAIQGVVFADTVTYTSEAAFVADVGSNPLGQENFSEYTVGSYNNVGPLSYGEGQISISPNAPNNSLSYGGINHVPNGSGNYALSAYFPFIGSGGLYYLGFSYYTTVSSVTINANGKDYNEAGAGFFGIKSTSPLLSGAVIEGVPQIDNVLYAGGPGISPSNPLYPDQQTTGGGCGTGKICWFWYGVAAVDLFFDPYGANAYTYQTLDGSLFTSVGAFPSGFTSPFDVSGGATDYGVFSPGETLNFPNGGVSEFTISGIDPAVDGSNPTAFPIQIGLNTIGANIEASAFEQTIVTPEPGSSLLCVTGIALLALRLRLLKS